MTESQKLYRQYARKYGAEAIKASNLADECFNGSDLTPVRRALGNMYSHAAKEYAITAARNAFIAHPELREA